ncbi:hypothetical protein ABMY26_15760 [Azospirillum sp. HJ39]|uniref:hypothetical protein n=1 Tax=Azospirillum sp. HJ39 TaxID=3159496 RepID=UPI0035564179
MAILCEAVVAPKIMPGRLVVGNAAVADAEWTVHRTCPPDYRKIAQELAQLGAEAARHARTTGDRHYDRLARTLTSRAGAILADLDRGRKP